MRRKEERVVGFGDEYSRRASTRTMNAFVQVETRPVAGGADVTITARRGYVMAPDIDVEDNDCVTVHVRKEKVPRIGERIMVGKRLVEVAERRWTPSGKLQVRDADSGSWMAVDQ